MTSTLLQWEKEVVKEHLKLVKYGEIDDTDEAWKVLFKNLLAEHRQMIAKEIEEALNEEIKSSQQWGHQGLLPIEVLKKTVFSKLTNNEEKI